MTRRLAVILLLLVTLGLNLLPAMQAAGKLCIGAGVDEWTSLAGGVVVGVLCSSMTPAAGIVAGAWFGA